MLIGTTKVVWVNSDIRTWKKGLIPLEAFPRNFTQEKTRRQNMEKFLLGYRK